MHQVTIEDCKFACRILMANGTRFVRLKRVTAAEDARFPKQYREAYYLNKGGPVAVIKLLQVQYPGESLHDHMNRMEAMATREERQLRRTGWELNRTWAVELLHNERMARRERAHG